MTLNRLLLVVAGIGIVCGIFFPGVKTFVPIVVIVLLALVLAIYAYGVWQGRWKEYDPSWLVQLAKEQQAGERPWLAEALEKCRMASNYGEYVFFVSPRPKIFRFGEQIYLSDPQKGEVVVHLAEGGNGIVCAEHRDEYLDAVVGGKRRRA